MRSDRMFKYIFCIALLFLLFLHVLHFKINSPKKITITVIGNDMGRTEHAGHKARKNQDLQQKCRIPKLDVNSSDIRHFFFKPKPLKCLTYQENWLFINKNGSFELIPSRKNAKCRVSYITRVDYNTNKQSEEEDVIIGTSMKEDFASVRCSAGWNTWSGLLMSVARRPDIPQASGSSSGEPPLSVYMLGFDSISHMTFERKLPKTLKFIEKELGSVVLNGYNIVGDGTPQAFIPILTGKTELELPLTRKRFPNANFVDDVYPFIWNNFSNAKYVTMFGEDAHSIGTYSYRLKGFRNSPTHHCTYPFFLEYEKRWITDLCVGSKPFYEPWFDYSRHFLREYAGLPSFLLLHQSLLSHDAVNLLEVQDDYLTNFLENMNNEGYFDNSVVILMADHGHRFEALRNTHQGQLEERLPFFSIALPKNLLATKKGQEMHANLVKNKDRLTTPFDIHATLMDVLNFPQIDSFSKVQKTEKERSLSLFRPIPIDRTCAQASIEEHWCTCLDWQDITNSTEDTKIVNTLSRAVVSVMNDQLANVRDLCANLTLARVHYAKRLVPNEKLMKYNDVKDYDGFEPELSGNTKASFAHYQIKLQTTPGDAIYEVTLFYDSTSGEVQIDLSAISHVNRFGDKPHCIIDKIYSLATFCVCHDKI